MKITLLRDDGKVNTLRTLKIELLLEQMKTEVKAQPVSKMREALRYTLPGNSIEGVRKVPKVIPAAAFVRKEGVMTLNEYNGIVMMEVNHLSGRTEADEIKELVKEFPQTFLAFTGSSGKSVKIWVRFTYPDDRLPVSREQVELFHAHAYQTAVKYYQPQLPFDIELKEPLLEQYCRLTYDPELYFNPEAMPIYMKQPVSLPSETAFIRRTRETDSPLQRMAPGYENYEALSVLFSAAFILGDHPDGIMLSNGPGDPKECTSIIKEVKKLYDSNVPIFAICLGHQLMALATGGDTYKMKYGHRGGNHPVKDLATGRVYISSQNHGYVVDAKGLEEKNIAHPAFVNVNDGTNEGMAYVGKNIFTVQFHPEACPGPQDSGYLFDRFMDMMGGNK